MKRLFCLALMLCLPALRARDANSLEFLETYAWGDREAALRMLAPNTEDFHYFTVLHHQLSGNERAFQESMNTWRGFLGRNFPSQRYSEIARRQALLDFDQNPEAAWELIRRELNLRFNHQRRTDARAVTHPSRVDPNVYSLAAFRSRAARDRTFPAYSDRGLELLDPASLNREQRRILLSRISRPDFPGLIPLILEDLANDQSPGFGSLPIHNQLTRVQLEELAVRRPQLLRSAEYVAQRLARIPAPDTDLSHDHAAAVAHFTRVWDFVRTLEPMHNSLKASTLFRLMDHQRHLGIYDEALFRAYLELPRNVGYLPRELRQNLQQNRNTEWVNFRFQPGNNIVLPPIFDETPLVREFLIHFLKNASAPAAFERWFEERWLNEVFAESKILHGIGRPEDQAGRLTPAAYRALLDRVELNFAATNPSYLKPGEAVELQVDVKRIDSLRIKLYEIQTFNYYSTRRQPVDQAVELDGLVAAHERTLDTSAPPGQRVRHTLAFPEITARGVYVVELIGGGVSSRALLHIGQLESVSQATAAGQAVMILNESGEHVPTATLWLNGRDFTPNENGIVLLPYSENPGVRFAILRDGDFSTPEQIQHFGEQYAFSAGIHLDPQNLPRRRSGSLLLRPDFRINGIPLDPAQLGDVKVTLASVDARGTRTEREFTAEFTRNREWRRKFYVPDDVRRFEVSTTATLRRRSDGERITLTDSFSLDVNPARTGPTLSQVFLQPTVEGWFLELRGLNGEPIEGAPLSLTFSHPGFNVTTHTNAATDARGRVVLGHLRDISSLQVSGAGNLNQTLSVAAAILPELLHVRVGEPISLAYPFDDPNGLAAATLLRNERGAVQEVLNDRVRIENGELRIAGLPAGEYELRLHEAGRNLNIRVGEGDLRLGYIFGPRQRLQETVATMPYLQQVRRNAGDVQLHLRNHTPSTRVLVRASRYAGPGGDVPPGFGFVPPARRSVHPPHMQYVSGRNIGDEYRYVLDRQGLEVFAGTLLARPGLILNPWELRETVAEQERLRADSAYRGERQRMAGAAVMAGEMGGRIEQARRVDGRGGADNRTDIGFDFLPQGSQWMTNLVPEANGRLTIPLADLAEQTVLDIIVVDRFGTSRSRVTLPDRDFEPREVRLLAGLNPDGSFSRQKSIRALAAGGEATLPDLATSRYALIRSFGQAFDLLRTLGSPEHLNDFDFVKRWPGLDEDEKRTKYGEFASHELHLFLYHRDRAFFDAVVRPYLANKKDSTFIDRWLLDTLTPDDMRLDQLQNRNAMELALLARRGGNRDAVLAALREQVELLPPDPDGFARLVRVALQSADLDDSVAKALQDMQERAQVASGLTRSFRGAAAPAAEMAMDMAAPFGAPAAAPAPAMPSDRRAMSLREEMIDEEVADEIVGDSFSFLESDPFSAPGEAPVLFRALPRTKEWAEQNYYKLRVRADVPGRIPANAFWLDIAAGQPVSAELLRAHGSLTEVLVALAMSGLPFEAEGDVAEDLAGAALTLRSPGPALLVTEQILPAADADDDRPLLISQQFYRPDDRYRHEGNEQIEKFITGEFIRRVVYGGRVTLTNPTANRRRLNVLMQIPQGAIPVQNGFYTDDRDVLLEPYTTRTIEFAFYFPFSGEFAQFPAHAAADEAIIGRAETRVFRVVDAPTEIDRTSWAWISQNGSTEELFAYLDTHNLRRLDLNEMAWRLRDREVFTRTAELLASRLHWHDTTFSYAIHHQDLPLARQWLTRSRYAAMVGLVLDSPLLTVDPVERKTYEHLEYDPLVNPRAHRVGETRTILNPAVNQQYRAYLANALYIGDLSSRDRLGLLYYLLLQDRLAEARDQLARVNPDDVHEALQRDYLNAWFALRLLDIDRAAALAAPHLHHPVPRWRERFTALNNAILEARGEVAGDVADPDRQQRLDRAAAGAPSLEIRQDGGRILVHATNLPNATLNLYPMDIELLFSRRPFQADSGEGFAIVRPAFSGPVALPADGTEHVLELPADFRDRNVVVELTGQGLRESVTRFANRLNVRVIQSFGQIEVRSSETNDFLPRTYVKVFARGVDGRETFWKDGYTDLRGRFDYLSLNDRQPEEAAEFSILILHPEHGALIRQAIPPTR